MASKTCTTCLQTLQRQTRTLSSTQKAALNSKFTRSFATTSSRYITLPEPNQSPATSIPPVTPTVAHGATKKALQGFKKMAGSSLETYTAFGATEFLYVECAKQAYYDIPQARNDNEEVPKTEEGEDLGVGGGWWHTELGLKPTFSTWSQVTMLHLYLLSTRFRNFEPKIAPYWQQHLLDHFFFDAETKMEVNHNMVARGTRNKYLKDMYVQWRGLLAAYDEGLVKGDAVLAAAVWRNLFKADENVDVRHLAQIVSFMRRTLKALDSVTDGVFHTSGLEFGTPAAESQVVTLRSPMMDLPFDKAPGNALPENNSQAKPVPGKGKPIGNKS